MGLDMYAYNQRKHSARELQRARGGRPVTPQQWERTADVLEEELGLQGHPRAIVLHEKDGRVHVHVVWQRTDIETMTLVSDSWNYLAHEKAIQTVGASNNGLVMANCLERKPSGHLPLKKESRTCSVGSSRHSGDHHHLPPHE